MALASTYTMLRSQLGRQPMFCETRAELCDTIAPDAMMQREYMLRNPVHREVQETAPHSIATTNTPCLDYTDTGMNHQEGGWPRDVHTHDPDALARYRRRIEKDDGYVHSVIALAPTMERHILQNNAIEMYQIYYSELATLSKQEQCKCRTVNVFRKESLRTPGRPVSSIAWQPHGGRRVAVAYVDVDFDRISRGALDAYIWDISKPSEVDETLIPSSPLIDLQFNPRDENILIGGLMNGQVCSWDRRAARTPTVSCPPHVSHRDLVRSVLYINTKSGTEFFSGGADGTLKWWDIRNMSEPTEELILELINSPNDRPTLSNAKSVCSLEYQPTIPTRFMVGTEDGFVITGNRKGKTAMDKLPGRYNAHVGPVYRLQRNPHFLKNFLTVGDWTARIWSEEVREFSIMWTLPQRYKITDGAWSPTRDSLMLLTQGNGVLTAWDLLRRQNVLTVPVCEEPLVRVSVHQDGKLLTCGSRNGDVYLLELSRNLTSSDRHDKSLLAQLFERDTKSSHILQTRLREIRLKQRQGASPSASSAESSDALGDRDLAEVTAEYLANVRKEQHLTF